MDVTIEEHFGTGVRSKEPVYLHQYRVRVDGLVAGYISDKPGAKLMLIKPTSPMREAEIGDRVAVLLKEHTGKSQEVETVSAPDVPEELRNQITNATTSVEVMLDDDID